MLSLQRSIRNIIVTIEAHPRASMWYTALFAVIYYMLVALQGLDYADEGFSLTFYQQIFSHPEDVEYLFLYYLTGLLGGVWELLFGGWGNYGFRVFFALISGCNVLVAFSILRRYLPVSTVLLGCLACILWPGLCLYYFNHDCLTVLLFLLSVWALLRGIEQKPVWLYLAGFLLMLNVFTRLPNATAFVLVLLPLVDAVYSGAHWRAGVNMLRIMAGMAVGLAVMCGVMLLLGHQSVFLSALEAPFVMSGDSSDTHSIANILSSYAYSYKSIITITIYGFLVALVYVASTQLMKVKGISLIAGVCCVAMLYGLLSRNAYGMWGAVTSGTVIYMLSLYKDRRRVLLGITSLVFLLLIPVGGDSYNNVCNSCMWLGMPLLVSLFRQPVKWDVSFRGSYGRVWRIGLDAVNKRHLCYIAGVAFLLYVVMQSCCYFDDGSKIYKLYRPATVGRVTTYTTRERAEITEDVVAAIKAHKIEGDYLLVFDNAPMLHYLTGLKPYLGSPWGTFWGERMFEDRLFRSENSPRPLPLIAVPRFYYKDLSPVNYFDVAEWPRMAGKAEVLLRFMRRNGYREVYSDPYILLYVPYDGVV